MQITRSSAGFFTVTNAHGRDLTSPLGPLDLTLSKRRWVPGRPTASRRPSRDQTGDR
jgi:hypothetical protein